MKEVEISSGFFNALIVDGEPDRTYNAEDMNKWLSDIAPDYGVVKNYHEESLKVVANSSLNITVRRGRGRVYGHWFDNETDQILTLSEADTLYSRIDNIVVKLNTTDRTVKLAIVEGVASQEPVAPTRNSVGPEEYEIVLAEVLIEANATQIIQSNITDRRSDELYCGWIYSYSEMVKAVDDSVKDANEMIDNTLNQFNSAVEELNEIIEAQYFCNGVNDGEIITQMALDFLQGSKEGTLKININGTFTSNSLVDNQSFVSINEDGVILGGRYVILDFMNAYIQPNYNVDTSNCTTFCYFDISDRVTIQNAVFYLTSEDFLPNATTVYGVHGGRIKDCCFSLNIYTPATTIYGAYGCAEVLHSEIMVYASTNVTTTTYGVYGCDRVQDNTINSTVAKTGTAKSMYIGAKQIASFNIVYEDYDVQDDTAVVIGNVNRG